LAGRAFVIRSAGDGNAPRPGESPLLRGSIIGMTRLFNVEWKDKRLEIGHTWYIPSVWGKIYNKECKLLLLQYVFEHLKFNRVEFRVAHQNVRSQRAVEKIGGLKEGVLRKHSIRNDGSRRDTVVFSIIDDEWPEKKGKLQSLLRIHQSV
jgi:RimJ/RimL family protein N-acetyltransferase